MSMKTLLAGIAMLATPTLALAGPGHGDGANIGHAGKPANVDRTVEVEMGEMYYEPESIEVSAGETVRFVLRNEGDLVHEFAIGTDGMHEGHREEMAAMMDSGAMTPTAIDHHAMQHAGMAHDDPNSVLLEPGETAELIWTFEGHAEIGFACNLPGHSDAGMKGEFVRGGVHAS